MSAEPRSPAPPSLRIRHKRRGLLSDQRASVGPEYQLKEKRSSHSLILRWLAQRPPSRILDLGCSSGLLAQRMRQLGHHVTGVDLNALPGLETRVDRFIAADLDRGLPPSCQRSSFDIVVAADVLEHVREPEMLLEAIHQALTPAGILVVSVPNFGHWYPRGRTALGLFDYDQRGLLDRGHIRFFTRRGILTRLQQAHFAVKSLGTTGVPVELLISNTAAQRAASAVDRLAVAVWPTLFGYQFVLICHPKAAAGKATRTRATI